MSYLVCFFIGFLVAAVFVILVMSCLQINQISDYEAKIQYLKMKMTEKNEASDEPLLTE